MIYLTNVMNMPDGRMWSKSTRFSPDPRYKVPVLEFEIDDRAAGLRRKASFERLVEACSRSRMHLLSAFRKAGSM